MLCVFIKFGFVNMMVGWLKRICYFMWIVDIIFIIYKFVYFIIGYIGIISLL